jgi:HEPN domain-containing protein
MKNPPETARRWLAQAEHSLAIVRTLIENGFWADVCFHAEQTAQLALKAFLYGTGRRYVQLHSIRELAEECAKEDEAFLEFVSRCGVLDRYYLSTRYPDVLSAPAVPFESFVEQEAIDAQGFASEFVNTVRAKIPVEPFQPAH